MCTQVVAAHNTIHPTSSGDLPGRATIGEHSVPLNAQCAQHRQPTEYPHVTTCAASRRNRESRERRVVGLKGPTGSICKGKLLQPIPEPGDAQCMLVADAVLYFQTDGIRSAF